MTGVIILILGVTLIVTIFMAWHYSYLAAERERLWFIERGYDPYSLPDRARFRLKFPWLKLGSIVFFGGVFTTGGIVAEANTSLRDVVEVMLFTGAGFGLFVAYLIENRKSSVNTPASASQLKRLEYYDESWVGSLTSQIDNSRMFSFGKGRNQARSQAEQKTDEGKGEETQASSTAPDKTKASQPKKEKVANSRESNTANRNGITTESKIRSEKADNKGNSDVESMSSKSQSGAGSTNVTDKSVRGHGEHDDSKSDTKAKSDQPASNA